MSFQINFNGPHRPQTNQSAFLSEKFDQFKETIARDDIGFFRITDTQQHIKECQSILHKFKERKNFIHIGIGGSSLGPEMLIKAFPEKSREKKFYFINNIDPDEIEYILSQIKIKESLFYFVSKSGGTAETLASLSIISHKLKELGIPEESYKDYFVFATDPITSQLKELGETLQISQLAIPSNIGGRFTVFTSVGLFPALFAGLNVTDLLAGANDLKKDLTNNDLLDNILVQTAMFLMELKDRGINQTVFMPYSSLLKQLSFWLVQLWAESLGKKFSLNQDIVYTGLTPIPAYGATDQHSQVQLFMQGPRDKCLFLIEIEKFQHNFSLDNNFRQDGPKKLAPHNLEQLMQAELQGTMQALKDNERPFIHLSIARRNERNIGALILYFESLTVLMGHILSINPFDQPGVELGKKYAFKYLKSEK